jgi:branched-chain amino acid transport system permease protein
MTYALHLAVYFEIYAILAISLNLVVGYAGLLTLAHAAYFAIGGYTYALLTMLFRCDFPLAAASAAGLSAFLSLAISLPSWRFRGDLFTLLSLAVQTAVFSLMHNWTSAEPPGTWTNLTNGPFGLTSIASPQFWFWEASGPGGHALIGAILLGGTLVMVRALTTAPWGRLLKCQRDDELAARSLGKNTRLAKMQVMAFSCGLAGLAGSLYASYVGYLDPSSAGLDESILMLCMVIVGGSGNLKGPLVGAGVLLLIPELLRLADLPDAVAANLRLLGYGALLVLLTHWRPQGLAGEYRVR